MDNRLPSAPSGLVLSSVDIIVCSLGVIPLEAADHLFDCFPSLAECLQCIRFLISTISWAEDSENDQIRAICAVVIEDNPGCECHPDDISQDSFFTIIKIL